MVIGLLDVAVKIGLLEADGASVVTVVIKPSFLSIPGTDEILVVFDWTNKVKFAAKSD